MKNHILYIGYIVSLLLPSGCREKSGETFVSSCLYPEKATFEEKVRLAAHVVPAPRQLAWQQLEFTCFICYGINTFTNKEWGTGKEDPRLFNPTSLDARQWVRVAQEAGMKMVLLTCKHHDGFCLWPSAYTDFSVASSPWKEGKGDLVREVAQACQEYGLKFAVYLSPWDMNHPAYGTDAYNDYFVKQLTELLTRYGPITEVWFDGACGEGPNGKKQIYDFKRYYETIRKWQPEAVIAVMGPDVRWVGTESGYGRDTEWSVIPASARNLGEIASSSQQKSGTGTFLPEGSRMKADLGSRGLLEESKGVIWYPSEVDVSIRPGWYYHPEEDSLVKSPQKLIDIFYSSIGKNSLLLLNLPPDTRGMIHENDVRNLREMHRILRETFSRNLVKEARCLSFAKEDLTDGSIETYWEGRPGKSDLEMELDGGTEFDRLLLRENITRGQRIEAFTLECQLDGKWQTLFRGTTVGYKRIARFAPVKTTRVRIRIEQFRDLPQVSEIGLYKSSPSEALQ